MRHEWSDKWSPGPRSSSDARELDLTLLANRSLAWLLAWRGRGRNGRRAAGQGQAGERHGFVVGFGGRAGAKASLNRAQPEGDRDIGGDSLY